MQPRGNHRHIFLTLLFFFLLFGLLPNVWGQTISLVSTSGLTATVQVTCPSGCSGISIDWRDSSPYTTLPASSPVVQSHTYSSAGMYCIQLICSGEPCNACSIETGCSAGSCLLVNFLIPVDIIPPTISITSPTASPAYATSTPSITLGGNASDNVGVTQVTWVNNRGGSGTATGNIFWTAAGIALQSGANVIAVTAHDAAGNTGTDSIDTITVTYTPSAGAFSVTPSPSSSGVVSGQQNVIPVIYTASAAGGGTFTAGSSQGRFVTESGFQLGTINQTVVIRLVNGSGMAPESVIMQPSVIDAALGQKQNRIYYERTFNHSSDHVTTRVALQVVPASAGPFSLVKMALAFVQKTGPTMAGGIVRLGRATVPRNSTGLKAAAHITYNGAGLLMGQWKVDGQVIGYVSQYLYAGVREVAIESPDVPGLPTYDTGQHSVELEIIQPTPPFEEPIIYYYVTQETGGGTPQTLQLISPDDHATVSLSMAGGIGPEFHWEALSSPHIYHLELYPAYAAATHGATLPFGGGTTSGSPGPIISADTQEGSYNLSQANMDNLQPGVEYTWRVQAFQGNEMVASSVYWTVSFETVQAEGGEPYFEFLHITPAFQENQGPQNFGPAEPQSHWFHFGPRNAYAIEMGTGGFHLPDSMEVIIQGEQGQSTTVMNVAEGQEVSIEAGLKNPGNQEKQNIRVEFLVDGQLADFSFIPVLAPGQLVTVQTTYEIPDAYSHTVEVRATEGEGAEAVTLASIQGYMANEEGEQTQLPTEPPEEGFWIGAFNLKPTNVTNEDLNNYTGSGTIEIPFMSEYPVDFSGLKINDQEKKVTSGQIGLVLEGLDIVIGPVTVHFDAIVFQPTEARCEGSASIPFAFSPDPLALNIADLIVLPVGLSGKLSPSSEVVFGLIDPTDFVLTISPSSFVRLHDNAILYSSFDGKLSSPDSILHPTGTSEEIQFSGLELGPAGGIYGNAVLAQSRVLATNIKLSGNVVLDLSNTASPASRSNEWKGIYVADGSISLPGAFSSMSIQGISGLFIDGIGVTGQVEKDNLGDNFDLQGGFSVQFTSLSVGFEGMSCTGGSLRGEVGIPIVKTGVDFNLLISQQGNVDNSILTINENKEVAVPGFFIKLGLQGGSVSIEPQKITAELQVTLTTQTESSVVGINVPSAFSLVIDSTPSIGVKLAGQTVIGAWITLDDQEVSFDGAFDLSLEKIGFGIKGSKFYFGVKGAISIANIANAEATILTLADSQMSYSGIEVGDIHLGISQAGAFSFEGDAAWYDDDPELGHGFKGNMELNVIDTFDASATLRVGSQDGTNYWYIAGAMSVGGTGIPLTPVPISIYGFTGGAYYNMTAERNETTNEVSYTVHDRGFGLMAGIVAGTAFDNGFTWHGTVGLEVTIGDGTTITLGGDSYILCKKTEEPANRKVTTEIQITTSPFVFSGRLEAEKIDLVDAVSLVSIQHAEIDLKLAADDWHFYVGTKQEPVGVRVLPRFVDIGASGYFGIDQRGMRAGARFEVDTEKVWILIFYGRVWGGFQGDFEIGFRPPLVYAEFSVWIGLEAGVGIPHVGSFQIFEADAFLNAGVRAPDPTRFWASGKLHYTILEMFSGTWSMTFTWGDSLPSEIQPRPWPCFESVELEPVNALGFAYVESNILVEMTTPIGKTIKDQDRQGNEYDAIVQLGGSGGMPSLTDDDGTEIPWHIKDNNVTGKGAFSIIPDQFFAPNHTYHFVAHARAIGSLVQGGYEEDSITKTFNTGSLPAAKQMIEETYPFDGQKYFYTEHPIKIKFKKGVSQAFAGYELTGKLLKEDGTEAPGNVSLNADGNIAIFQPSNPLDQNSDYVFKLYKLSVSSDQSETNETAGSQGNTDEGGIGLAPSTVSIADTGSTLELEIASMLTIHFETGSYGTFRDMLNASALNLQFYRNAGDLSTYYLDIQNIAEPVYWKDIAIDWEPEEFHANAEVNDIGECIKGFTIKDWCRQAPLHPEGGEGTESEDLMEEHEVGVEGHKGGHEAEHELPETDVTGQQPSSQGGPSSSTYEACSDEPGMGSARVRYITRDAEITASSPVALKTPTAEHKIVVQVDFKDFKVEPHVGDCSCEIYAWSNEANGSKSPDNNCIERLYDAVLSGKQLEIVFKHKEEYDWVTIRTWLPHYPDELVGLPPYYSYSSGGPGTSGAETGETSGSQGTQEHHDVNNIPELPDVGDSEDLPINPIP